ncbi:hypothetical protein [Accumulibacter sp.]|uniref:hypothetical protein n=1 Tax=Accumulibacter sp. TaxID=2053492 RepID=UPI0025CFF2C2|nr:hypothetical protein [Accumulibacter sp.]MCM8612120.1 hypothetical protein [Accumulibacter sp.]MCM8635786.1 hypothetical protein [Accumulibacter sp.]MCM8639577.1 hypothetical protein [Accumulibacter sp.]
MSRLNILVLHRLGNPRLAPSFLCHHVFALRDAFPEHNYLYHDTELPLPDYVRDVAFDAIVLDVTFLCIRWLPAATFQNIRETYSFVGNSGALKLAFPQDEYDCNELLDDWLCDWQVDVVFSVISSHWQVLYPRYHRQGSIRLGYTGYVDQTLLAREARPLSSRRIDIGYRARRLPPYFGRIGVTKWAIGELVEPLARRAGLTTDIVLGDQGTLLGPQWLDFLGDCRFTLGANSGSSLLDPRGEIQAAVRAYLRSHPGAPFEEVEANCFPGLDGRYAFTAISPRVLEAGLLGSCQILVEGDYSGIVRPWEHYIPIRSDATDFPQVLEALRDRQLVARLVRNCRETILGSKELHYGHQAATVIGLIESHRARKATAPDPDAVQRTIRRYQEDMQPTYRKHWRRQSFRRTLSRFVDRSPTVSRLARGVWSKLRG